MNSGATSDAEIVRTSYASIAARGGEVAEQLAGYFYARLFVERPAMQEMFPVVTDARRVQLLDDLLSVVVHLDEKQALPDRLERLMRAQRTYDIRPEHHDAVGAALISSVERYVSAGEWTDDTEAAWRRVYDQAAAAMTAVAERSTATRPAWWDAVVVTNDRRTPEIAVLTLRLEQPMEFTAGEYVPVETPMWPRVWRPYGIANAPRADSTIDLHVRAVDGGWVSGALVRRTPAGTRLRVGRPAGSMVAPAGSTRDVVCVTGGVGLGAVKSVVEQLLREPARSDRRVRMFVGARTARELYDLQELRGLQRTSHGVDVVPVVSEDPTYVGERGLVGDVATRWGTWTDHDVFVCGSPEMVSDSLYRLRRTGVPPTSIRYQAFGDMDEP